MAEEAKHPVRTTAKTLRLVEALSTGWSARIRDLESELDLTKSAIHSHLSTLREHGYVVKDGREYRLSLAFLTLGGRIRNHLPLYRAGRPQVDEIAEETGELVNLMTEEAGMGVHLYQSRGGAGINRETHIPHIGSRMYLHHTALGKAVLAHLPRERVDEIVDRRGLPAATEHTITDRDRLDEALAAVDEQGFAVANEERAKGLHCVAAPVFGVDDEVLGAISISAPTSRVDDERDEVFRERVRSAATMIQLEVTYVEAS